jgi:hypothetical protein
MKQKSVQSLVIALRICGTALVLSVMSLFLFSFVASTNIGDEVWKQLGLNKQQGTEGVYRSFTSGYLYHYDARNATNIATGNRLAVAKDLLDYTKQYINSDAFKKEYEKERQQAKPEQPELKPVRTKAEVQKEEIAKMEKSLKDSEKSLKDFTPEMRKGMEPVIEMFKKTLKEYQDPNHQYFESLVLYDKYQNEANQKRYAEDMLKWQHNYPADFSPIIRERLSTFLERTKDVDFTAALKTEYNKKKFVNPVYERKSVEWKQAFRAGKDITQYARAFAEKWLAELK